MFKIYALLSSKINWGGGSIQELTSLLELEQISQFISCQEKYHLTVTLHYTLVHNSPVNHTPVHYTQYIITKYIITKYIIPPVKYTQDIITKYIIYPSTL